MKRLEKVFGVDVRGADEEQAIEWVKVMSAIPADTNPLLDDTGNFAELGDVGDIHYLAGNFGGETTRTFEVDLGDALVLPLINGWNEPARDNLLAFFEEADITEVFLRIDLYNDGKYEYQKILDVTKATYYPEVEFKGDAKRAEKFFVHPETEFEFSFPENNIYDVPGPGTLKSYTTGYYVSIDDLPEGTHKIEFGGTAFGGEVEIAVTDIVTVLDGNENVAFGDADLNLVDETDSLWFAAQLRERCQGLDEVADQILDFTPDEIAARLAEIWQAEELV